MNRSAEKAGGKKSGHHLCPIIDIMYCNIAFFHAVSSLGIPVHKAFRHPFQIKILSFLEI